MDVSYVSENRPFWLQIRMRLTRILASLYPAPGSIFQLRPSPRRDGPPHWMTWLRSGVSLSQDEEDYQGQRTRNSNTNRKPDESHELQEQVCEDQIA